MRSVDEMGPKWRKIAALLPNRSDDAVRNRWHRLSEAQRHREDLGLGASIGPDGQPSSLPQGNIGDRSSVYRCSRCGQPKKAHVCTAPEAMSSAEQVRAACAFFLPHPPLATCLFSFVSPLSVHLSPHAHSHRRSCVRICNRATPRSRMAICAQHGRRRRTRSFLARSTNSVQSGLRSRGGCQGGRSTPHGIAIIGSSRAARRTILHERESRE